MSRPLTCASPLLQSALAAAQTPAPGLPAGLLVNSAVFLLGIQVLLRGEEAAQSSHLHALGLLSGAARDTRGVDCCAGLTPAGVLHSWALGTVVYAAFGPGGYALVCLYFLLGSAVRDLHRCGHRARCMLLREAVVCRMLYTRSSEAVKRAWGGSA